MEQATHLAGGGNHLAQVAMPEEADADIIRAMLGWREADSRDGLSGEYAQMDRIYHVLRRHLAGGK